MNQPPKVMMAAFKRLTEKGILRDVGTQAYNYAPSKKTREQIMELQRANLNQRFRADILSFVMQREDRR
jgi:hypothetical protein